MLRKNKILSELKKKEREILSRIKKEHDALTPKEVKKMANSMIIFSRNNSRLKEMMEWKRFYAKKGRKKHSNLIKIVTIKPRRPKKTSD